MNEMHEKQIQVAQQAAQSGVLQFLERAEEDCIQRLCMKVRAGATDRDILGEACVLSELRRLQDQCVQQIKIGAYAAMKETGGR